MNFLLHMLLSGGDDDLLTGNFMGDFVKGPLAGRFPPGIEAGLALHRALDRFAEQSVHFRLSRQRIAPHYRLYRGVLIDLFYDHFLVREWDEWSHEPFGGYLARSRAIIESRRSLLPERLQGLVPLIFKELLPSYGGIGGIATALQRMSWRVKRPNPLAGGEIELVTHYEALQQDFRYFMPEALRFAAEHATGLRPPLPPA